MYYFEDLQPGVVYTSDETYTFTKDNIMAFAREFDPMPFHLDEDIAKLTPMGGLFASAAQTIAVGIKLSHTLKQEEVAAIGGLGWDDVRFPVPVMAGDALHITSELIDKRESRSKPDRGIVTTQNRLYNQNGELVAEFKIRMMVWRKPA